MTPAADRRLLLVHAHPDDESINNGATMARYAAEGAHVTLVTCTRGELGEVIPPELAHLAADRDGTLGEYRVGELADAMRELGVRDHRFLDEVPGFPATHYRDSGMAWGPDRIAVPAPDTGPDAFSRAELEDAAARLAAVVREVRPQVVVTYEPGGGYGHPDHVMAHRVTMRAVRLAQDAGPGGEPWRVPKVYWVVVPMRAAREMLANLPGDDGPFTEWFSPEGTLPPMFVDDDLVTAVVDGAAYGAAKAAAMRAHRSQISVDGPFFALSNDVGQPLITLECYQLVQGEPGVRDRPDGRESDLFSGVA